MLGLLFVTLSSISATLTCSSHVCVDIQEDGDGFRFNISGKPSSGFLAIGIGTRMNDADMFITWFESNGRPRVTRRTAEKHDLSTEIQSPHRITSNSPASKYIVFTLPKSNVKLDPSKTNSLIWAHSDKTPTANKIPRHTSRGWLNYSFQGEFQGEAEQSEGPSAFILWHGFLMLLAWLILPSSAIFTARFLKDKLGPRWLAVHQLLFASGAIVATISIIIVASNLGNVLDDPHAAIGVVVMALFGAQIILGVVIDKLWYAGRTSVPWQDKLHWWLGRCLFLLAIVNIFYGIVLVGNPLYLWVPTFLIIAAIIASFILGEKKMGKITH